jgi:hypothetical protein
MKIYTRTGDDGTTGLLFGGRVRKDDPLPSAYGDVDEAQAMIGVVRAHDVGCHVIHGEVGGDIARLRVEHAPAARGRRGEEHQRGADAQFRTPGHGHSWGEAAKLFHPAGNGNVARRAQRP